MKLLFMQSAPTTSYFLHLRSIVLGTLFSKPLSLYSSLNVRPCFIPIKTDKIVVLSIFV